MKTIQDRTLPVEDHYIRQMIEFDTAGLDQCDEGDSNEHHNLRIVVCMTVQGSRRLLDAQYIQSDIGFKRIIGFEEFELASFDRDSNTSK